MYLLLAIFYMHFGGSEISCADLGCIAQDLTYPPAHAVEFVVSGVSHGKQWLGIFSSRLFIPANG